MATQLAQLMRDSELKALEDLQDATGDGEIRVATVPRYNLILVIGRGQWTHLPKH